MTCPAAAPPAPTPSRRRSRAAARAGSASGQKARPEVGCPAAQPGGSAPAGHAEHGVPGRGQLLRAREPLQPQARVEDDRVDRTRRRGGRGGCPRRGRERHREFQGGVGREPALQPPGQGGGQAAEGHLERHRRSPSRRRTTFTVTPVRGGEHQGHLLLGHEHGDPVCLRLHHPGGGQDAQGLSALRRDDVEIHLLARAAVPAGLARSARRLTTAQLLRRRRLAAGRLLADIYGGEERLAREDGAGGEPHGRDRRRPSGAAPPGPAGAGWGRRPRPAAGAPPGAACPGRSPGGRPR